MRAYGGIAGAAASLNKPLAKLGERSGLYLAKRQPAASSHARAISPGEK
jgi:hypothetical protein